jgi:hypothetical protein
MLAEMFFVHGIPDICEALGTISYDDNNGNSSYKNSPNRAHQCFQERQQVHGKLGGF